MAFTKRIFAEFPPSTSTLQISTLEMLVVMTSVLVWGKFTLIASSWVIVTSASAHLGIWRWMLVALTWLTPHV